MNYNEIRLAKNGVPAPKKQKPNLIWEIKNMKRTIKIFSALFAAAVLCFSLVACGGSGVKYNYKETKITVEGYMLDDFLGSEGVAGDTLGSVYKSLESVYDAMYKDSTIEVKDGEIVWSVNGQESISEFTKDGDQYIIGGELYETLSKAMTSAQSSFVVPGAITVPVQYNFSMYGQEVEDGFILVMEEDTISDDITGGSSESLMKVIFTLNFTKA